MSNQEVARWFAIATGVVLVLIGLLGFINNPIVGDPSPPNSSAPLFVTGTMHNIVHLVTGAVALYIGFMLKGDAQANALIGFGALYAVVLVATLLSPNLFGLLGDNRYNVNTMDHVLHLALAVLSIGIGYWARGRDTVAPRRT
ncbi:MAG TPA: DUF4383 domain-containing protein [Candidatus Limnocylindrales bacterium]|nr:DUF4383 domain-containing protein [Candidatus Limnocylindrales bacterium]